MSKQQSNGEKVILIVMDGWGLNREYPGNAVALAKTPFFDELWRTRPAAVLEASGESVGLPEGQMGTSEVNHFAIGAGRVIFQDLVRINKAVNDGSLAKNEVLIDAMREAKKRGSKLHFLGLLSDGGVHSHQEHLYALLEMARGEGLDQAFIHVITDGRDTSPRAGLEYVHQLEAKISTIGIGTIASVVGRYFAMDRDHNWPKTDKAFHLLTKGEGEKFSSTDQAIRAHYHKEIGDEHIEPCILEVPGKEPGLIAADDVVMFYNFRNDRPRQLTERLLNQGPKNLKLVTMTQYHPGYHAAAAFPPQSLEHPLGEILQNAGLKQLRITETEKFPHMTFFLNCQREAAFEGEDRFMLDSYSDIKTHDEKPYMRTPEIAKEIVEDIKAHKHDVIFTNLCNADMVGHTGNIPAAIVGCETVDKALAQIIPAALENDYHVLITADHGNADEMLNEETGEMITSHSLNPVPLILLSNKYSEINRKTGTLIDIAPTMLEILGLEIPDEMTGKSFL